MQYLLLLHVDEGAWPKLPPEEQAEGLARYRAYTEALQQAGVLVASSRLNPSDEAQTVRTKGGRVVAMDGPFAETKEQVAGFYLIEAADQAEAVRWAEKCPALGHGVVEVRKLFQAPAQAA